MQHSRAPSFNKTCEAGPDLAACCKTRRQQTCTLTQPGAERVFSTAPTEARQKSFKIASYSQRSDQMARRYRSTRVYTALDYIHVVFQKQYIALKRREGWGGWAGLMTACIWENTSEQLLMCFKFIYIYLVVQEIYERRDRVKIIKNVEKSTG